MNEYFTDREMFLMKQAMIVGMDYGKAGIFYESLNDWLNEVISDGGHIVAQLLKHDADRLTQKEHT